MDPVVSIVVQEFDPIAHRSDPKGALIRYDAGSSEPIVEIDVDLEGDGEPAITYRFENKVGNDGRYNRALAPKFTVNGTWPLIVTAVDAVGRKGSTRCTPGITVTF